MMKIIEIQELQAWDKLRGSNTPLSFDIELTARCNNNCRHCYINLPASKKSGTSNELSIPEIERIADQATDLGVLWCCITGGEPLLRSDFDEIYLLLKRKGFLINLFTNACLVNARHIDLFKNYPPRDIEVTVYGVTRETYEAVTRVPGSFKAFKHGLDLLQSNGFYVTLKAMAIKSNQHEWEAITQFCEKRTARPFRFDPFIHLRYDRDPKRNEEIKSERLTPTEIVALEMASEKRSQSMLIGRDTLVMADALSYEECKVCKDVDGCEKFDAFGRLFRCGIGNGEFNISFDGHLRLCSTLSSPGTTFDLRTGQLRQGLEKLRTEIRQLKTNSVAILKTCKSCKIINLCMWCPAVAYLETGDMEGQVDYFCAVAHARAAAIQDRVRLKKENLTP